MSLDKNEAAKLIAECLPSLSNEYPFYSTTTTAADADKVTQIQVKNVARLWAGMGSITEINFQLIPDKINRDSKCSIIVKHIQMRCGMTDIGDLRKRDSYLVEKCFYQQGHAKRLIDNGCSVPRPLFIEQPNDQTIKICMTKLQGRPGSMDEEHMRSALTWLAKLHALYWVNNNSNSSSSSSRHGCPEVIDSSGLQPQGGYWYLDTRPEEHQAMPRIGWEGRLHRAARAIDQRLKSDPMQTMIHGDCKDANMLFTRDDATALVCHMYDFQYIGKAPPAKDLAYLFTCASNAGAEAATEEVLLCHYHRELSQRLLAREDADIATSIGTTSTRIIVPTMDDLRTSLALSYADLGRWMSGWGWWGNSIKQKIENVLNRLDNGKLLSSETAYMDAMQIAFPLPS